MAGCTVSVALFVAAMNLLLEVEGMQWKAPVVYYGTRRPACKAFMDDISLMTSLIQGTQQLLSSLEKMTIWSQMQFKAGDVEEHLYFSKGQLLKHKESDAWGSAMTTL